MLAVQNMEMPFMYLPDDLDMATAITVTMEIL